MITDILKIKEKDVISIVGCGGKTTTMFAISQELCKRGSVVVTTSTKIGIPKPDQVDLFIEDISSMDLTDDYSGKVVCVGNGIINDIKVNNIEPYHLRELLNIFDYIVVESDGCRRLPLKGWRENEPVIYEETSVTLGIFSIKVLGNKVDEETIFALEKFTDIVGNQSIIDESVFLKLIVNPLGIFKNSKGRKYIFFNQCDTEMEILQAKTIIEFLKKDGKIAKENIGFIYGSAMEKIYYEY